jgi:hypothetical protein
MNTDFEHAFIDGDIIRYLCGFAIEYDLFHVEGHGHIRTKTALKEFLKLNPDAKYEKEEVVEPPSNAIQICKNYIAQIERTIGCPSTMILSGSTNFRDDIATIKPYKGNRPDRKPKCFQDLTDWMIENGAVVTDGIEADDLMAIRANEIPDERGIICTIDKDLLQVPGWHYNFQKDVLQYVDEEQAHFNLCVQILAGDSTDNIQGIPGIGVKKAEKMLQGCESDSDREMVIIEAYMAKYGDEWPHFVNENAALVYILRYPGDSWSPWEGDDE